MVSKHVSVFTYNTEINLLPKEPLYLYFDRLIFFNDNDFTCSNINPNVVINHNQKSPKRISYWQADIHIMPIRVIINYPRKIISKEVVKMKTHPLFVT